MLVIFRTCGFNKGYFLVIQTPVVGLDILWTHSSIKEFDFQKETFQMLFAISQTRPLSDGDHELKCQWNYSARHLPDVGPEGHKACRSKLLSKYTIWGLVKRMTFKNTHQSGKWLTTKSRSNIYYDANYLISWNFNEFLKRETVPYGGKYMTIWCVPTATMVNDFTVGCLWGEGYSLPRVLLTDFISVGTGCLL